MVYLLTFPLHHQTWTKQSATLNCCLARPEKEKIHYIYQIIIEQTVKKIKRRCITGGWMQVGNLSKNIQLTFQHRAKMSSGERRVKQQCVFLIRLGAQGSHFKSFFLAVDTPERLEFLSRQSSPHGSPRQLYGPLKPQFTSVQLIRSNSRSFRHPPSTRKKGRRVGSC